MIERAAEDLEIDVDALSTIVFIHETAHAYSHVGQDRDRLFWEDFTLPVSDRPDFSPSQPHEAIAQFYTYTLLKRLADRRLTEAFLQLESASIDVYRAWRSTEHYTLEEMREVLIQYRRRAARWPPRPS